MAACYYIKYIVIPGGRLKKLKIADNGYSSISETLNIIAFLSFALRLKGGLLVASRRPKIKIELITYNYKEESTVNPYCSSYATIIRRALALKRVDD